MMLEERVGGDVKPLTDHIKAVEAAVLAFFKKERLEAKGLLVAAGIRSANRTRFWVEAVEGEIPEETSRKLTQELERIKAFDPFQGPMAFGLQMKRGGVEVEDFPQFPKSWVEAALEAKGLVVPPDEIFEKLWPREKDPEGANAKPSRPAPPEGFEWQDLDEDTEGLRGAAVLRPKGWHFGKTATEHALVYKVSKDLKGRTSFTLNIIPGVKKMTGIAPSEYAVRVLNSAMKDADKVLQEPDAKEGVRPSRLCCEVLDRYALDTEPDKLMDYHVRHCTIAVDELDYLYVVVFGSPEEEWKEMDRYGQQMMKMLLLPGPRR